ncbi:hypothetical protein [Neolewinella xylanilytica]|uniref:hypothetical protein n=1 Tax=Neolewinella xylanilytica TaxID=1514080 RepID=UPI0011B084D6|nr:hypothetical protein [Neolewinella xylanilytica]
MFNKRSCIPSHLLLIGILITLQACSGGSEAVADRVSFGTGPPEPLSGITGDLQGTWRSADDSLHTLLFDNTWMVMAYEGETAGEAESFVVGPTCPDAPDSGVTDNESRYLSVPVANRCYYIIELTDTSLAMSYVGRGNTLRYVR